MKAIYAIMLFALVSCTAKQQDEKQKKFGYSITITDANLLRNEYEKNWLEDSFVEEHESDSAAIYSAAISIVAGCATELKARSLTGKPFNKIFPTIYIVRENATLIDGTALNDWSAMNKLINGIKDTEIRKLFKDYVVGFGTPAMISGSHECLEIVSQLVEERF